jgi:HSP20 family protein
VTTANLRESAAEIVIELELPGVEADEVEVTVLDHVVTVRGGHEADPEGFGKRAAGAHAFQRELQLPLSADVDHLSATLRSGALELHAPKQPPRPRRVPVRVAWRLNDSSFPD